MSRGLGFDLVLSRGDVRIGGGRLDDLVIRQHVGFDDLGEDFRIQSAEEGRNLVEQRLHSFRRSGVDRVANFLLSSSLDANQADLLADDDGVARPQRAVAGPIIDRSLLSRCPRVGNEFIFRSKKTQQGILTAPVDQITLRGDRDVVFDNLFDVLGSVAQLSSERPQIGELRFVLGGVLICFLSDRYEDPHMRIDPVQASQGEPRADWPACQSGQIVRGPRCGEDKRS